VTRPGGRVVVTSWGSAEDCAYAAAIAALRPLVPPPPPGAGGPFALSAPGALEGLLEAAGLPPLKCGSVACPFEYPDAETSYRAQARSGVAQRAIEHSGEAAVRTAIEAV